VRRQQAIAVDEFDFVRASTSQTPKTTLPSPPSMHWWRVDQGIEKAVYPNAKSYFTDLAAVYRQEIAALAAAGSTYIQLDDVPFAMLCDPEVRVEVASKHIDPDQLLQDYVALCNDSLRDLSPGVTVAMHFCPRQL
jgi:5-methyltetrahydropteroyltriglutamate--homocysteine methyltransferase